MTTLVLLFLFIVVPVCVGGVLGYGLAWLTHSDAYEPAAAETPESDTAAVEAVEAFFTDGVPVVPDAQGDLLTQSFESKLYELLARADAGEDITAGAPREQT